MADVDAIDLDREDHVLATRRARLAVVEGPNAGDEQVAELVLAGSRQRQTGLDRSRVRVVGMIVADRQQLDVVLAGNEAGRRADTDR